MQNEHSTTIYNLPRFFTLLAGVWCVKPTWKRIAIYFGSKPLLNDIGILFKAVLVGIWLCPETFMVDYPWYLWDIHLKVMQKLDG